MKKVFRALLGIFLAYLALEFVMLMLIRSDSVYATRSEQLPSGSYLWMNNGPNAARSPHDASTGYEMILMADKDAGSANNTRVELYGTIASSSDYRLKQSLWLPAGQNKKSSVSDTNDQKPFGMRLVSPLYSLLGSSSAAANAYLYPIR